MTDICTSCRATVSGSDVLYTPSAKVVCPTCFAKIDLAVSVDRAHLGSTRLAGTGAAIGAIPFVISFTSSTNGVYRDWVAIACGVIALVCALIATISSVRSGEKRSVYILSVAALALGALQLARGFGAA